MAARRDKGNPVSTLSLIIPTLNAAAVLSDLLAALRADGFAGEIIVADGGSTDETATLATRHGARVIASPPGRGTQLCAGAAAAQGAWLLFLHADCRLQAGWRTAVAAFTADPMNQMRAGYFALRFDDESPAATRIARLANWRSRTLGLPYGDQGLLITRDFYQALGGYADIPLMEDVDLVRRIGKARLAPLPGEIVTSAAKYRRDGYLLRPVRNLACLGLYFAGVSPHHLQGLYR
ncbi:MAG: TIGR04283 family arsenosugar biosynthesis glycosyltransferase [Magnetospiraceae bacterium]